MAHQLEQRIRQQVLNVAPGSRVEIVDAEHFVAALQQSLAQVGTDKAGAARHENAAVRQHRRPPQISVARATSFITQTLCLPGPRPGGGCLTTGSCAWEAPKL